MKQKVNGLNVIKYAGAYIAFIIGSGFATGQEIIQFYTPHEYGVSAPLPSVCSCSPGWAAL